MQTFIVFDINSEDQLRKVKDEMIKLGYHERWTANDVVYNLPKNSLWKVESSSLEQAKLDIQGVITSLNKDKQAGTTSIELLRCMVLPCVSWSGISGRPVI